MAVTRHYLRNTQSNPGTGGTNPGGVWDLSDTQGTPTTMGSGNTQSDTYITGALFTASLGTQVIGTSFPTSVNMSSVSASTMNWRFRIQRRNSSGAVQEESANVGPFTDAGIKTSTLSLSGPWDAGDRLTVIVEFLKVSGGGNRSFTLNVNNADSYVDADVAAAPTAGRVSFAEFEAPNVSGGGGSGPVNWINLVNTQFVGGVLSKISGDNTFPDGGATGDTDASGDCVFEFTAGNNTSQRRVGLGSMSGWGSPYNVFAYQWDLGPTGWATVAVNGTTDWGTERTYAADDVFRVEREGNDVRFYHNDTLAGTYTPTHIGDVRPLAGLVTYGGDISAASFGGGGGGETTPTRGQVSFAEFQTPELGEATTLLTKVGRLVSPTSTGNQSYTGVGFQPKLVLFMVANHGPADDNQDDLHKGFGAAISSSARLGAGWEAEDGLTPSRVSVAQTDQRCVFIPAVSGEVINGADLVTMDSDGFTLNWTDVWDFQGMSIFWMALGGDAIEDAALGVGNARTSTGDEDYTVGFQPDLLVSFAVAGADTFPLGVSNDFASSGYIGFASDPSEQVCAGWRSNTNTNPSGTSTRQLTDTLVTFPAATGNPFREATLKEWLSNGFRLTWNTVNATAARFMWVALKGTFDVKVGSFTATAAAADVDQSVTTGFPTKAVMLLSSCKATDSGTSTHNRNVWGAADEDGNQFSIWGGDKSGVMPTVATTRQSHNKVLRQAVETGSETHDTLNIASMKSMDATGFTLNWENADTMGQEVLYLALGSTVAEPTPTRGRLSFAEIETPSVVTRGRLSFAEVEIPDLSPTRGRVSFAETEIPEVSTRGRISFTEFEAPLAQTRGRVSFTEVEVPLAQTRGRLSFTETEVPFTQTRGRVSFAELETPLTGTRGRFSFAEIEVPLAPSRGRLSFAEAQVPDEVETLTRGRVSFAEAEVPLPSTRGRASFVEFEAPLAGTRGRISFTELEAPIAPSRGRASFTELETPLGATRGRLSFAEFDVPLALVKGRVAFAELELPLALERGRLSFTELEVPELILTPTRGKLSFTELEFPDSGFTRGRLSFTALELPGLPARGRVSFMELDVPLVRTGPVSVNDLLDKFLRAYYAGAVPAAAALADLLPRYLNENPDGLPSTTECYKQLIADAEDAG